MIKKKHIFFKKNILVIIAFSAVLAFSFSIEYINNIQINSDNTLFLNFGYTYEGGVHSFSIIFENQKTYIKVTDVYLNFLDQKIKLNDFFLCPYILSFLSENFKLVRDVPDSQNIPVSVEAKIEILDWNKKYLISFDTNIDLEKSKWISIPFDSVSFKEI